MRFLAVISFLFLFAAHALNPGELQFTVGGKKFSTTKAQSAMTVKNGKVRILIAVKDTTAKFMLIITADVDAGDEKKPLILTTEDSSLSLTLRTLQGSLAILPHQQLVRSADLTYTQRVEVQTDELEEEPRGPQKHNGEKHQGAKLRKKMKAEYRQVKPVWHAMSKKDRLATGEGVIQNGAFRGTFFSLQLNPVVSGGKVVSLTGGFTGSGRSSNSISGAELKPIHDGVFSVKVQHAP